MTASPPSRMRPVRSMARMRSLSPADPLDLFAVEEPVEFVDYDLVATAAAIHHVPVRLTTDEIPRPDKVVAWSAEEVVLPGVEDEVVAVEAHLVVSGAAVDYVVLGAGEHAIVAVP